MIRQNEMELIARYIKSLENKPGVMPVAEYCRLPILQILVDFAE